MTEAQLESKLRKYAVGRGCLFWKFTSPGVAGVPDRVIATPFGVVAFLEIKALGEKPRALQVRRLDQLKYNQVACGWVDNLQDGKEFIDALF